MLRLIGLNKYIAFIDILGFKDLVLQNDHAYLVDVFSKLFKVGVEKSLIVRRDKETPNDKAIEQTDLETKINSLLISDTAIFWTDNDSPRSFMEICFSTIQLMAAGFYMGLPLRGAISVGELSFLKHTYNNDQDNSQQTLIGRGLVNAYELERKQEWAGCIIDELCVQKYREDCARYELSEEIADIDFLLDDGFLTKYQVPYIGGFKEEVVINWTAIKGSKLERNFIEASFGMHKKSVEDVRVKAKIKNTLDFFDYASLGGKVA